MAFDQEPCPSKQWGLVLQTHGWNPTVPRASSPCQVLSLPDRAGPETFLIEAWPLISFGECVPRLQLVTLFSKAQIQVQCTIPFPDASQAEPRARQEFWWPQTQPSRPCLFLCSLLIKTPLSLLTHGRHFCVNGVTSQQGLSGVPEAFSLLWSCMVCCQIQGISDYGRLNWEAPSLVLQLL